MLQETVYGEAHDKIRLEEGEEGRSKLKGKRANEE